MIVTMAAERRESLEQVRAFVEGSEGLDFAADDHEPMAEGAAAREIRVTGGGPEMGSREPDGGPAPAAGAAGAAERAGGGSGGGAGGSGAGGSGRTVPVTVTYLEMTSPDQRAPAPGRAEPTAILRAHRPTISFYRYLYDTVGEEWWWFERRRLSDEALAAIVQDDRVEVHVLYVHGVPAGYAELDRRVEGEVELAYFGLIPEYVGRGFGPYLLDWALARAWSYGPRRVWLHTCTLDHPGALTVYRRGGLQVYDRKVVHEDADLLERMFGRKYEEPDDRRAGRTG